MSLVVYPYIRDREGKPVDLWPGEAGTGRTLAGFEALRKEFYGSEEVARVGCRLLNSLKEGDIFAEKEDLDVLQQEVETVLAKLDEIVPRLDLKTPADYISERLHNIAEAIKTAKQHPSGKAGVAIS